MAAANGRRPMLKLPIPSRDPHVFDRNFTSAATALPLPLPPPPAPLPHPQQQQRPPLIPPSYHNHQQQGAPFRSTQQFQQQPYQQQPHQQLPHQQARYQQQSHSQPHCQQHSHPQPHYQQQLHQQQQQYRQQELTYAAPHHPYHQQQQFGLPAHSPPMEDVQLDDLTRLCLLGCGSGGKVYKVQHKATGKIYALKIIQQKHEPKLRRQIIKEVQILRGASSPYVVRCFGVYERAGEISFLLEYMDGGTLADLLKREKKLSEAYLAHLTKQVLTGLAYLHKRKIVHRDIKPSNLLLSKANDVKIADFGVSTVLAYTMAQCNSFVGTCAYMSPERFNPEGTTGNYDGLSADIWSLGLTLLECAVGRFPCLKEDEEPDWPNLMVSICLGDPPSPPAEASLEFQDFIRLCLQKAPQGRPSAFHLLKHPYLRLYPGQHDGISDVLQHWLHI